jgi:sulfur-carrier protein
MAIKMKFIGALRHASGKTQATVPFCEGDSIKDLILKISQDKPEIQKSLIDLQLEAPKTNALILINGREISVLAGLETKLCDGDEVVFIPVVHGG